MPSVSGMMVTPDAPMGSGAATDRENVCDSAEQDSGLGYQRNRFYLWWLWWLLVVVRKPLSYRRRRSDLTGYRA